MFGDCTCTCGSANQTLIQIQVEFLIYCRILCERDNLSTKDTFHISNCILPYEANAFSTSEKRTASLQGIKLLVPKFPLLGCSTVHVMMNL